MQEHLAILHQPKTFSFLFFFLFVVSVFLFVCFGFGLPDPMELDFTWRDHLSCFLTASLLDHFPTRYLYRFPWQFPVTSCLDLFWWSTRTPSEACGALDIDFDLPWCVFDLFPWSTFHPLDFTEESLGRGRPCLFCTIDLVLLVLIPFGPTGSFGSIYICNYTLECNKLESRRESSS